jgi:hypothetical protein
MTPLAIVILLVQATFTFGSLILGLRLCLLARRTRQLPESLLGVSFLVGGFLASLLGAILYSPAKPAEPLLTVFLYVLRIAVGISDMMLVIMAWRVFRPNERWAKILVFVVAAIHLSYILNDDLIGRRTSAELVRRPVFWIHFVGIMTPLIWNAWEAALYQARLKRRFLIGLPADLVVAARMQFWALGMGTEALMFILLETIRTVNALTGSSISPALMIATLSIVCVTSIYFAFFTPRFYLRRLEAEAARSAA